MARLCLLVVMCASVGALWPDLAEQDQAALARFQKYIQIDTSRQDNLHLAVEWWRQAAAEAGLEFSAPAPAGLPVCVLAWRGARPHLPSILLNSHMDVVPVDQALWKYPPFGAHIDENGNLYGRGTQDTKDVSVQYLEAIRRLKMENVTLDRTFYITLMPDEEIGGENGMKALIKTDVFKSWNIGFVLDEGMSSLNHSYIATYQDRRPWQMKFTFRGPAAHGSSMPEGCAMEKVQRFINKVMTYREEQIRIRNSKRPMDFGSYSSVNINMLSGGLAVNIIPGTFSLLVDLRLATRYTADEAQALIESWMAAAGNGTTVEYIRRVPDAVPTRLDDSPYWVAMQEAIVDNGGEVIPIVCPATTDVLVLRNMGIPAVGFTPKTFTVSRIHGNDEYQHVDTFLRGIEVYKSIIRKLGSSQLTGLTNEELGMNNNASVPIHITSLCIYYIVFTSLYIYMYKGVLGTVK